MKQRKPVLIVDDSSDSLKAMDLLRENGIEFVNFDIRKFADSCCGDLPTTKAPSVFAPEGVFKGLGDPKVQHEESRRAPTGNYIEETKIEEIDALTCRATGLML
jgi:hypothetical protein